MNISYVIGNLGADAEVVTSNGQSFISLSIADSRKFKKQDGTEVTQTNWVDAIISNADHPVLPYLKQGVKVCVIGNSSLRVYSSKKDRMMKAGQTIHVLSIELCGGSSDEVPRQLIDPETGLMHSVFKFFYVDPGTFPQAISPGKKLTDQKGREYVMNETGLVTPLSAASGEDANEAGTDNKENHS